ncbi:S41 family peptidase [Phenylobacterium sp.]|uniref:S41 family peptidase n=1 Tax=Phenylobacterium sp. TaxID=1871053 RepID=UPI003567EF00
MRRSIAIVLWLGLVASPQISAAQVAALTPEAKQEVVAKAAAALADGYVYPDRGRQAGAALQKSLEAGNYAAIADKAAFAARLTADLQAVTHDKHMRVMDPGGPPPAGAPAGPPPRSRAGFIRVDRLQGNIGYIALAGFPAPGMFKDAADAAMRAVEGTDALIIDMRRNGGGSPEAVAYLCSFLFDPAQPTHLNDLIYRNRGTETFRTQTFFTVAVPSHYLGKPVILITSPHTFSGGEEFTNDLKVLKRARVVGETTGGGANPGGVQPVGAGLLLFVPGGRAENPITKTSWEGVGVIPDVPTAPQAAFAAAYRAALEAAPAAPRRAALKARLAATGGEAEAWTEAALQTPRTERSPRAEAALRGVIEHTQRGDFDAAALTPDLAEAVKPSMPDVRKVLADLGPLQSLTFKEVDMMGADVYHATFAHGGMDWVIYLTDDGKIAAVFYPVPPVISPSPAKAS